MQFMPPFPSDSEQAYVAIYAHHIPPAPIKIKRLLLERLPVGVVVVVLEGGDRKATFAH